MNPGEITWILSLFRLFVLIARWDVFYVP